jgi:adenosylcobinamide-GDP ribazoletransferase
LRILRGFLHAVSFLTVLPVRPGGDFAPAPLFFAPVGALLGLAIWALLHFAAPWLGAAVAAALAAALLALITGGLHEDGLADVFDALRAGRTPERMLAILKDSRIGAHGAVALIAALSLRVTALTGLATVEPVRLALVYALSRGAMLWLALLAPPVGGAAASWFRTACSWLQAWLTLCFLASTLLLLPQTWMLIVLSAALLLLLRSWFVARLGGVNGDCLGTAGIVVELGGLLLLLCLRSS